jgi:hypothetical protein
MGTDSTTNTLPLPKRLITLIDLGLWPRTDAEERHQNLHSLVSAERVQLFAPEERKIYLLKPPFRTVAERMRRREEKFWSRLGALGEISTELCLEIGAFELGSDSPILLDYRQDGSNPAVIRLLWRKPQPNSWVRCADSFDQFANMLGLDLNSPPKP